MDCNAAIMVMTPALMPLVTAFGINPIHFGLVMVLNLMIGLLTPPFGLVLFVISKIGNISIGQFSKALVPWIFCLICALLLITFVPALSLTLPAALGMSV